MPHLPREFYWHVHDWQPTGRRAHKQVTRWRLGTYMVLMVEESGVEFNMFDNEKKTPGDTLTRWRRGTVNDVCDSVLS